MTLRSSIVFLAVVLFSLVPAAQAPGVKSDVYFGYSRVGANLYNADTPGMNGWQAAAHFKPFPFVGIEGDVSRFSANAGAGSQNVTLVMFGPRVTVRATGFSSSLTHSAASPIFQAILSPSSLRPHTLPPATLSAEAPTSLCISVSSSA